MRGISYYSIQKCHSPGHNKHDQMTPLEGVVLLERIVPYGWRDDLSQLHSSRHVNTVYRYVYRAMSGVRMRVGAGV